MRSRSWLRGNENNIFCKFLNYLTRNLIHQTQAFETQTQEYFTMLLEEQAVFLSRSNAVLHYIIKTVSIMEHTKEAHRRVQNIITRPKISAGKQNFVLPCCF